MYSGAYLIRGCIVWDCPYPKLKGLPNTPFGFRMASNQSLFLGEKIKNEQATIRTI